MTGRDVLTAYSKVSVKSQIVLPAEVRARLGVGPGDRLRYVITPDGIRIAPVDDEGRFTAEAFPAHTAVSESTASNSESLSLTSDHNGRTWS